MTGGNAASGRYMCGLDRNLTPIGELAFQKRASIMFMNRRRFVIT